MPDDNRRITVQKSGRLAEPTFSLLRKRDARAVLQRVADGDQNAVQECVDSYGGLVWSLATRMLRNKDEAEEAVQEIFVDIWKNAASFDPAQSSETTFVAMIARRRLIDKIRFTQRQISANALEDILNEPAGGSETEHRVLIEGREAFKVLNELRPEQRHVLHLSIIHGLSHQEIADASGMPLGTVKTHARQGLLQARELLDFGEH